MLNDEYLNPDPDYVFHGSAYPQEIFEPTRHRRGGDNLTFDDISFHATPYKWIALTYTCVRAPYEIDGKIAAYNMAVDLYKMTPEIEILGFDSLEQSLEALYSTKSYLYYFDNKDFFHTKGLGDLEVITQKTVKPVKIEEIARPLDKLKELGIKFTFVDLKDPKNEMWRNYKR